MLPLIDIVFLLLVFFIYAMLSMTVHQGMQLDLPESSQATKTEETPLTLSLRTSQSASAPGSELESVLEPKLEVFLNKTPISLAELHEHLPARDEKGGPSQEILVFAEENVSYQQLFQVLDELKRAGMTKIFLQANLE
jgi:biopolymer transport protein ExbD